MQIKSINPFILEIQNNKKEKGVCDNKIIPHWISVGAS